MTSSVRLPDGAEPSYGFGHSLVPWDGRREKVAHSGATLGLPATLAHYPRDHLTIVVLANRGGVWTEAIEKSIARAVTGRPMQRARVVPLSPSECQAQRRLVRHWCPSRVRIACRSGRLWTEMPPPGPSSQLEYRGKHSFWAVSEPDAVHVEFREFRQNRPQQLIMLMAGMQWYGRRVP